MHFDYFIFAITYFSNYKVFYATSQSGEVLTHGASDYTLNNSIFQTACKNLITDIKVEMGFWFLLSCYTDGKIYQYGFNGKYIGIKKEGIPNLVAYYVDTKGRTAFMKSNEMQIYQ